MELSSAFESVVERDRRFQGVCPDCDIISLQLRPRLRGTTRWVLPLVGGSRSKREFVPEVDGSQPAGEPHPADLCQSWILCHEAELAVQPFVGIGITTAPGYHHCVPDHAARGYIGRSHCVHARTDLPSRMFHHRHYQEWISDHISRAVSIGCRFQQRIDGCNACQRLWTVHECLAGG